MAVGDAPARFLPTLVARAREVGDHPGAAVEQACLRVEAGAGGEPDRAGRVRELLVLLVRRELVDHHADADAAAGEVRQRSPAVVDLQRAFAVGDAPAQVVVYGGLGGVEVGRVPGPLVQADEQQRLPRRAAQQAGGAAGPSRRTLAEGAAPGGAARIPASTSDGSPTWSPTEIMASANPDRPP